MNEIDNIGIPFVKQLDSQTDYLHADYMMAFCTHFLVGKENLNVFF